MVDASTHFDGFGPLDPLGRFGALRTMNAPAAAVDRYSLAASVVNPGLNLI